MRDLAPAIHRQRLVVEGTPASAISADEISKYLSDLSDVLEMERLTDPVTHLSSRYGWAGWIHWQSSGAHFYAWEQPLLFFSVDIYTCKPFDIERAVQFTRDYFGAGSVEFKGF